MFRNVDLDAYWLFLPAIMLTNQSTNNNHFYLVMLCQKVVFFQDIGHFLNNSLLSLVVFFSRIKTIFFHNRLMFQSGPICLHFYFTVVHCKFIRLLLINAHLLLYKEISWFRLAIFYPSVLLEKLMNQCLHYHRNKCDVV